VIFVLVGDIVSPNPEQKSLILLSIYLVSVYEPFTAMIQSSA
jgi:hypothetical protein